MVDLDKWEFISFNDIKAGDDLKVIINGENETLKTKTVTRGTALSEGWKSWYTTGDVRIVADPANAAMGFTTEIYRRKHKPAEFKFPTKRFSVIKGQRFGYDGVFISFVKTDTIWYHQSGSDYTEDTIRRYFHDFEVIFEGING
jgi:hypothetical protein